MTSIRHFIEEWRERFIGAEIEDARLNAELLLAHALGARRDDLLTRLDESLPAETLKHANALCGRRLKREPVDYIIGRREFFGREFHVEPGVLIPRPETERIVELALERLPRDFAGIAVDIGCGSGALAVTLALEFKRLRVLATDLHAVPLDVTRRNAQALGARLWYAQMDGLAAIQPAPLFDLVASNPPYVLPEDYAELQPEVRDHEPREALVGGAGGVEIPVRLLHEIAPRLKPGGLLYMEHGMTQGEQLREAAARAGLKDARTVKDYAGLDRILEARA